MDAGEFKYLHDQRKLDNIWGMWEHLLIEISRLMVFSSAYDKFEMFFEELKEHNGIHFDEIRVHLSLIVSWFEMMNSTVGLPYLSVLLVTVTFVMPFIHQGNYQ